MQEQGVCAAREHSSTFALLYPCWLHLQALK
jgi:hypothetical protein